MKALANESRNMTSYGVLIQDAKVFSGFYSKLLYSHTKREGNQIVHSLIRLVVNIVLCGWRMFHHKFASFFKLI